MNNKKGFILSTYVYMLLVFFLLLLTTMLTVMNNSKLLSNKLKEQSSNTSGLTDKDYSFILLGESDMIIRKGEEYIEPGFKIQTVKGVNLSDIVSITGNVDVNLPNTYKLIYSATYNGITKKLTRNVHVLDDVAANYITGLYNHRRDENGLIKDNTAGENIRYAGSNEIVKNYVEFGKPGELWRIIGVFDVASEIGGTPSKRVKLIRHESLIKASWDSSADGSISGEVAVNGGAGVNEWSQADINTLLNTYYLGTSNTCLYCDGANQSVCKKDCTDSVSPLSSDSINMIDNVVWKTSAIKDEETISLLDLYLGERGTLGGNDLCKASGSGWCDDTVTRKFEWTGKVALIYPSDYGYASTDINCSNNVYGDTSTCKNSNWLASYSTGTITPRAYGTYARYIHSIYAISRMALYRASDVNFVRPSLYLKSFIKITGGDGTENNPYKLSL